MKSHYTVNTVPETKDWRACQIFAQFTPTCVVVYTPKSILMTPIVETFCISYTHDACPFISTNSYTYVLRFQESCQEGNNIFKVVQHLPAQWTDQKL